MTAGSAVDEVAELCSDLIRIDTTNSGDPDGPGERTAAEYVMGKLDEVGLTATYLEPAPRRGNVVLRIPGTDPALPGLLVHGHLDVVPADPARWSVHPLSGELRDGAIWGRGAVDMKNMDAAMLAIVREFARTGRRPLRDVVFAWLADEETGGEFGSDFLVAHHAELFSGCTEAISEVGGYSVEVAPDLRIYLVENAQKGLAWLRLVVEGKAGHGSMLHADNVVTELSGAIHRIGKHTWPRLLTPTTERLLREICDASGVPFEENDLDATMSRLGAVARFIGAALSNTANPTRLHAGYATNVVPESACAEVDGRFLPGLEKEFLETIDRLAGPSTRVELIDFESAMEVPFDAPLVESMLAALKTQDPTARIAPYCLPAGTDNRVFAKLGINGYGFMPLKLPGGFDLAAMYHGIDERVPVDALQFAVKVLDRLLTTY
ncbi:M20/M25/M40 family metallo-hydrolase [Saccharothrix isguenensis]